METPSAADSAVLAGRPTRVLIVEDEPPIAKLLALKLERLGYEVSGIVNSGKAAIRETRDKRPDVVLMDIVIPGGMDGIETAGVLQRDFSVPVIYLTSHTDPAVIDKAAGSGAHGYVLKPFREAEVHAMIKLAMTRHQRNGEISKALRVAEQVSDRLKQVIGEVALKVDGAEDHSLRDDIESALSKGQFQLYYQPRADLGSGEIVAVEALLRWNHPRRGLLVPDQFLPVAEELGLLARIDEWVLRRAVAQTAAWGHLRPSVRLTVNVAPSSFRSNALLNAMERILRDAAYDPARLELDVTESVLIRNSERDMAMLKQMRSAGVRLAVDNFGVGYTSLVHLQNFPFDTLKIDSSFVRKAASGSNASAAVQAMIQLARAMGLATVGEGVETRQELQILRDYGCNGIQGFVFSPAVSATEMQRLLAEDRRLQPPPSSVAAPHAFAVAGAGRGEPDPITEQQQELIEQLVERRIQALRETNVELEEVAYVISHDLRAPLRAIIGFSSLLDDTARDKLDEEEARILDGLRGAGTRMSQQIDALLALSRLSRAEIRLERLDLSQLAHTVLGELRMQYPRLSIEADIAPGLQGWGDARAIYSVLENLLGNAVKFSSAKPVARIHFFRDQNAPDGAYCVADEGVGFEAGKAEEVFRLFRRLHSESEFPGSGVGLASVKRIVSHHGGRVWAESGPGPGARFFFTLPEPSGMSR